jgi:3-methylfumaryl-CoA hydratase
MPAEAAPLPPLWHWFFFLPVVPMAGVGADGHPKRGGFLPPVPLERRMWAGGRLSFPGQIRVGDTIEKASEILKVAEKDGRAGKMVFVTVRHSVSTPRGPAVEEEQDIVYMPMPERFTAPPPTELPQPEPGTAADAVWREDFPLDPVLLFRFSALTFNGHRIHYDKPYATEVEKYPDLVVHGPLQAVALMGAALRRRPDRRAARFSFRGVSPLFVSDLASIHGRPAADAQAVFAAKLTPGDGAAQVTMKAEIGWA